MTRDLCGGIPIFYYAGNKLFKLSFGFNHPKSHGKMRRNKDRFCDYTEHAKSQSRKNARPVGEQTSLVSKQSRRIDGLEIGTRPGRSVSRGGE